MFLSKHNGQVQLLQVVLMLFSQLELLLTFKCILKFRQRLTPECQFVLHLGLYLSCLAASSREVQGTLEKSTHRRCLSFNSYVLLLFFLRYNSAFNRNCSSLSHTFPNHQRLVQSKVNLLEYKNRLCRHETGDRLFQLAFFFGSLEQLQEKVFTPRSLSCLVCNRFFNMEASTLHVT